MFYRQSCKLTRQQLETLYLSTIRRIYSNMAVYFMQTWLEPSQVDSNMFNAAPHYCAPWQWSRTDTKLLMAEVNWDTLDISRRNSFKMSRFFLLCRNEGPLYLTQKIVYSTVASQVTRSSVRHNRLMLLPRCLTTCYANSCFPACARVWNTLNYTIVNCGSVVAFNHLFVAIYLM